MCIRDSYCTRKAVREKHSKYAAISAVNEYKFTAFAVESYGGMAPESVALLKLLSLHSKEYSPQQFLQHAYRRLSVTLQTANANIAALGIQRLHLHQHHGNPNRYAQYERNKQMIPLAYPRNTSRIERKNQHILDAAESAAYSADSGMDDESTASHSYTHPMHMNFADVSVAAVADAAAG